MSDLSLHLRLVGLSMLVLASLHAIFPKRFDWRRELARLSLLNRQIFIVHTLFIVLLLVLIGSLCLFASGALLERSQLAPLVAGGLAVFWGLRLLVQLFGYDSKLWRGRMLETIAHIGFVFLWGYYTTVYLLVVRWHLA